jgi:hypothetical protein
MREVIMNRFTRTLIKVGAIATLALGSYALPNLAFAVPPPNTTSTTSADLLAQADHHAMMAAYYRARARADEKHAIQWFTMANHCDQKERAFRTAALGTGIAPRL